MAQFKGPEIANSDTLLYRQCLTGWWSTDENRPSSQLFRTIPIDNGLLSLANGAICISPERAYERHIEKGGASLGTATVRVQDFSSQSLKVYEDALSKPADEFDDDYRAVADYRGLKNSQEKKVATKLLEACGKRLSYTAPAPPQPSVRAKSSGQGQEGG